MAKRILPATALSARKNLERLVAEGRQKTAPVVEQILSAVPSDRIVRGNAIEFITVPGDEIQVVIGGADESETIHDHAWGQMLDRAGVPKAYGDELASSEDEWRVELAAHILNEHYAHDEARYLLRAHGTQVRGFLSDRYRRLDSRPLLDAFIAACNLVKAVPIEGLANDVRCSLRAIIPTVYEPVEGEAMVFGLAWNNSDYGSGTYGIHAFIERLVCLNGMMGESQLKQVHLGGRLPDNLVFSEKTYQLDTETMVSATTDVVRSVLSQESIDKRCAMVRAAHEVEADFESAFRAVSKALTKTEIKAARDAFNGPDVVMLPPGQTLWRASNALSWIANQTDVEPARKLELQALAGTIARAA